MVWPKCRVYGSTDNSNWTLVSSKSGISSIGSNFTLSSVYQLDEITTTTIYNTLVASKDGYVGIGTTTPSKQLQVNGVSLLNTTGGSDFKWRLKWIS